MDLLDEIKESEHTHKRHRLLKDISFTVALVFIVLAIVIGVRQFYLYEKQGKALLDSENFTDIMYPPTPFFTPEKEIKKFNTEVYNALYQDFCSIIELRKRNPINAIIKYEKIAKLNLGPEIKDYYALVTYFLKLKTKIIKSDDFVNPVVPQETKFTYKITRELLQLSLMISNENYEKCVTSSSSLINSGEIGREMRTISREIASYATFMNYQKSKSQ